MNVLSLLLACSQAPDHVIVHPIGDSTSEDPGGGGGHGPRDPDPEDPPANPDPGVEDPTLASFELVERDDHVEGTVVVEEGTGDLDGGTLLVQIDGGEVVELAIPGDLESAEGGELVFRIDEVWVGECKVGAYHDVRVQVVADDGGASSRRTAAITTADVGVVVEENGEVDPAGVGLIAPGDLVCGELDLVGNDGFDYTGDLDYVGFVVSPTDLYSLELRWEGVGDWDLYVYAYSLSGAMTEVGSAISSSVHSPEVASAALSSTSLYVFEVAGWSGDPGAWTVELL